MNLSAAFDVLGRRHSWLKSLQVRSSFQQDEVYAIERVAVFVFLCEQYLMLDEKVVNRTVHRDILLDGYPQWGKEILDHYCRKVKLKDEVQHFCDGGGI